MATITWTFNSGTSASWSTTTNWSPNQLPGSADTALINNVGTTDNISFDSSGSLGALTLNNSAATLNFTNTSVTVLGAIQLTSGTLSVNGTGGILTIPKTGTSSLSISSGGTLNLITGNMGVGKGGITISGGTANLTGGGFTTLGSLSVNSGVFTLNGTSAVVQSGSLGITMAGGSISLQSGTLSATTGQVVVNTGVTVSMSGNSAQVIANSLGVLNNGTISGFGIISTGTGATSDLEGNGKYIASGGTLSLVAAGNGFNAPSFSIADNSTLLFSGPVGANATVDFSGGTTGDTLSLTSSGNNFLGTLTNFSSGDTIAVTGAQSYVVTGSNVQAWSKAGGTGTQLQSLNFTSSTLPGNETINATTFTVCFAAGSRIRTKQGNVPVEQLAEGQRVAVLRDGAIAYTPITWIGERRINLAAHPQPQTAAPVRILRGAIGDNLPERDLLLSPDHCLFLDGKLIPAKSLINGMTIVQERWLPAVHYFHVEVDPHAVLLAEGLPVESYLDTGNRAYFQNCGTALVLHPEFTINAGLKAWETHACAPLMVQPEAVQPVWQRLADRAVTMGFAAAEPETTVDANLHLLANGRAIRPMSAQDGGYVFALPAGCDSVQLVSRATIPSDLAAWRDDWRCLGVAVSRLVLRTAAGQTVIPADHPALARGWHPVETDGATTWRWTDGKAELAFGTVDGPAVLEVEVCNSARYIAATDEQASQRLAA